MEETTVLKKASQKLIEMLRQNTGRAMCDSGGYPTYDADGKYTGSTQGYGRHYEWNQCIEDWDALPTLDVHYYSGYTMPSFTLNVYKFLKEFLSITEASEKLQAEFQQLADDNPDEYWVKLVEKFPTDEDGYLVNKDNITNTYNHDSMLSQVLQYKLIYREDSGLYFIILQTHNGADVRGGYSTPYIFEIDNLEYFHMAQWDLSAYEVYLEEDKNQLKLFEIEAVKEENRWSSDDCGYNWYCDNNDQDDLKDVLAYSEDKEIWYNKKTGNEIKFHANVEY